VTQVLVFQLISIEFLVFKVLIRAALGFTSFLALELKKRVSDLLILFSFPANNHIPKHEK